MENTIEHYMDELENTADGYVDHWRLDDNSQYEFDALIDWYPMLPPYTLIV